MKTLHDHERACLDTMARYSLALSARDEHDRRGVAIDTELKSAEAALRALARRNK